MDSVGIEPTTVSVQRNLAPLEHASPLWYLESAAMRDGEKEESKLHRSNLRLILEVDTRIGIEPILTLLQRAA